MIQAQPMLLKLKNQRVKLSGMIMQKVLLENKRIIPKPWGLFIFKDERYKILKAELGNKSGEIGEVMSNDLEISCGNQKSIKIIEIQRQGKKPQNINEFVLGSQIIKGSRISNV